MSAITIKRRPCGDIVSAKTKSNPSDAQSAPPLQQPRPEHVVQETPAPASNPADAPSGGHPADNPTKVRVRNLNFSYGSNQVLHDISIDIPEKAVTALIGPSGCGKSTFLRTLNRMNDLIEGTRHTGTIEINGRSIHDRNVDVVRLRKYVGMVFQKSTPFPKSIFDNVAYGPRIGGLKNKTRLAEIVEECLRGAALWDEVKDRLHASAMALSGGQQQRLCIARTLATNPEVILMDEPASALDPASTAKVEELIYELRRDYTIVIVTHNMQQASRVSQQTAFFFEGVLIEVGRTEDIFQHPREQKTEDYITGRFG